MSSTRTDDRALELRAAIDRTGYYPEVVADGVLSAVAGEHVASFFVHHEPTFDHDEVRRHLSVVEPVASVTIAGQGGDGYRLAVEAVAALLEEAR